MLLGLWAVPTWAGVWLCVAALGAFLSHQPLKLALADLRRRQRYPRTAWAVGFTLLYGGVALTAFILALLTAQHAFWVPLLLAAPLALAQLWYDIRSKGRALIPELCGALALGSLVAALALAAGWAITAALALWCLLAAKAVGAIFYVSARLRLERGVAVSPKPTWIVHTGAFFLVAGLAAAGLAPWLSLLAFGVLAARAFLGLSHYRRPTRTAVIGMRELGFSLLTVACTAIGLQI
jgi:hypothetical protein